MMDVISWAITYSQPSPAVARGVRRGRKRLLSAQQAAHARKLIEQGEGPNNVAPSTSRAERSTGHYFCLDEEG